MGTFLLPLRYTKERRCVPWHYQQRCVPFPCSRESPGFLYLHDLRSILFLILLQSQSRKRKPLWRMLKYQRRIFCRM